MKSINFSALQTKLVLNKLVTQTILKYDEDTSEISKGDVYPISFENIIFKNYNVKIENVSVTSIMKLTNEDMFNNGFLYKPFFIDFVKSKGISESDIVLKVDFSLEENI